MAQLQQAMRRARAARGLTRHGGRSGRTSCRLSQSQGTRASLVGKADGIPVLNEQGFLLIEGFCSVSPRLAGGLRPPSV